MSKQISNQSTPVNNQESIYDKIDFPQIDKKKYPHGGYAPIKDFGWIVDNLTIEDKYSEEGLLVTFDNLHSASSSEKMVDCADLKPFCGYDRKINLLKNLCFLYGYRDGEIRCGVLVNNNSKREIFLGEGVYVFDIPGNDFNSLDVCEYDFLFEFKKDYFLTQARQLAEDGLLTPRDFLSVSLFRQDVVAPIVAFFKQQLSSQIRENPSLQTLSDYLTLGGYTTEILSPCSKAVLQENRGYASSILAKLCSDRNLHIFKISPELADLFAYQLDQKEGVLYNPFAGFGELANRIGGYVDAEEENSILSNSLRYSFCGNHEEGDLWEDPVDHHQHWIQNGVEYFEEHHYDDEGNLVDEDLCEVHQAKTISNVDPMANLSDTSRKYDKIAFIPPFGVKTQSSNQYLECEAFQCAVEKLNDGGRLVCVMPMAFTNGSGRYLSIRKALLDSGYSVSIIALPPVFRPLTEVNTCMVVVDKIKAEDTIHLVDGSSFFDEEQYSRNIKFLSRELVEAIDNSDTRYCISVSRRDLSSNDASCLPSRYLLQLPELGEGESYVPLSELVDLLSTTTAKSTLFVSQADLPENYLSDMAEPHEKSGYETSVNVVEGSALLAGLMGRIKVGKTNAKATNLSKDVIPFRAKNETIDEDYLLIQLMSDHVQKQYSAMSTGLTIRRISKKDFLDLNILMVPIENQHQKVKEYYSSKLSESDLQIKEQFVEFQQIVRTRKHNMGTPMAQLISGLKLLDGLIKRCQISDEELLNEIKDCISGQRSALDSLSSIIVHMTDTNQFGPASEVNAVSFLREYVSKRNIYNPQYQFHFHNHWADETGAESEHIGILVDPSALRQAIDIIVDNAIEHGFIDKSREDYRVDIELSGEGSDAEIMISNNGRPFHHEIDEHRYALLGDSSKSENGDRGRGGNYINEMTKYYGGHFAIGKGTDFGSIETLARMINDPNFAESFIKIKETAEEVSSVTLFIPLS